MPQVLLDQLVWTPPSMVLFFVSMSVMEGAGAAAGWRRALGDAAAGERVPWDGMLWRTMQINWPFWGGVHSLTYSAVVAPQLRVLFVSLVSVFWNGVLSALNQGARRRRQDPPNATQ